MAMAPRNQPIGGQYVGAGGRMLTPQQVAEQRKVAAALMQQASDTSPVGHWTAALNRGLQGYFGGRDMFKANETESNETARALSSFQNRSGMQQPSPVASALAGGQAPAIPAGADGIRQGLVSRGLPEHVADAFILNFQDESGLNPGINEISPTVPGSRGGFGLYQLTGPRREAYEAFAADRGVDPADVDAQLDWLMYELQGPESRAAQNIFAAQDAGTAAAAIVNDFLRPAPEHRTARANRYMGGAGAGISAAPAAGNVSEIAALLADPWLPASARGVLEAEMNQQMQMQNAAYEMKLQNQDPLRQLQIQQAQLELQAAQNPTVDPWSGVQEVNNQLVRMGPNGPEVVMDLRNPEAPKFQTVTLPDGSQALYQYDNTTGQLVPANVAGGGTLGTGGRAGLTESQAKTTLFSNMQTETNPVLSQIEQRYNPANTGDAIARATPIAGNFLQTEEGQIYQAAATAWAEGALRITTGAAATDPEIQRNLRVYFAQPGDTPATVAFKAQMRAMFERSIKASLGEDISGQGTLELPEEFAARMMTNAPPEVSAQIMGDMNGPRDYSTMSASSIAEILPTLQGADRDAAIARLQQIRDGQ